MYDPEDRNETLRSDESERVNGEYHFSNGYSQRIYTDAHYVRADDSTAPPRYYVPPEKTPKESQPREKKRGGAGRLIAACLISAILGGLGGGAMVGRMTEAKLDALSESVAAITEQSRSNTAAALKPAVSGASLAGVNRGEGLSAADIYQQACQQVVGITSEITYTNFFGMVSSGAVSGTGFIISEDGYILTNNHVIEDAYKSGVDVNVITHDGTRYKAEIVGVESDNDVALLKIDASGLNAAVIGNSDDLLVGDTVYAVGNPLGELEFSMTTGTVSAKDRSITTDSSGENINMFQIDAAVNSGNSGGPVYNTLGQVVGIVTAKYRGTNVEGIGFAIPINDAAHIASDLMTKGYVTGKAHLGVTVNSNYNQMYAQYYGWPLGAYVDNVDSGSCAEKAGIEAGDIITAFNGETVVNFDDLRAAIKSCSAGDTVEVEVYSADQSRVLTVTLDEERPQ